ncbi:uncharacterized protein LOC131943248 [Physella acuta]|uniref:uncharacterized protein LOC131943248 n=1 Tax=Physella acuta TaxID=109671 RepID=UPI0027DAF4B5|nr:uncharacterized protein LOC131943248 [Physella acuta]
MPNELKLLIEQKLCEQLIDLTIPSKIAAVYKSIISLWDYFGRLMKSESSCLTINPFYEDGYTFLLTESYIGNIDRVKSLLARNVDVNIKSRHGETALMLASQQGHHVVVQMLLDHVADLKITLPNGLTPLMLASLSGHARIVEILLKYGADINTEVGNGLNAILLAVLRNHFHVVEIFLTQKLESIKVETLSRALLLATDKGYTKVVDMILRYRRIDDGLLFAFCEHKHRILDVYFKYFDINTKDESGWTLLHYAANKGDDLNVEYLLKMRANINSQSRQYGESVLALATKNGHFKTVDLLLKNGANVDGINYAGQSHLMQAAESGKSEIVQLLLKNGADINKFDNTGFIALQSAVIFGHYNCVELLLKNHARVNHQSNNGASALIIAATKRHYNIVKLLLAYGADVHQFDENNNNALKIALQVGDTETIKLLLKHGATVNTDNKFTEDAPSYTEKQGSHDDGERNLLALNTNDESFITLKDIVYALTTIPISIIVAALLILFLARKICLHQITQIKPTLTLQNKMIAVISFYWDFFFDITNTPLLLQNVWGCDKTCQPIESGFFRLLNFRGKLHSLTHVQEVSPNCNGCLVMSEIDRESLQNSNIYLEFLLLVEYIKRIVNIIDEKLAENVNVKDVDTLRVLRNLSIEVSVTLGSAVNPQLSSSDQDVSLQLDNIKIKTDILSGKKINLSQMANEDSIKVTEPQLICSMFGLNILFEKYLLDLDTEFIDHRDLLHVLSRWLENNVKAIEETDQSVSLYDCMLRIGLSDESANRYTDYVGEEFVNMYSLLYWITKYFKGLILSNPLTTEITSAHLFENTSSYNIWETCDIQRTDYDTLFTIKVLNLQSQSNFTLEDLEMANNKVKKLRKKLNGEICHYYYHATSLQFAEDIIQNGIRVEEGEKRLDFSHGGGFYVINNFKTAMKWTRRFKQHNPAQAVIIYKVLETEMESGKGLKFDDVIEWRQVVTACRKGFPRSPEVSKIRDKLRRADYIEGFLCSNGRQVTYGADPEIYQDGEFRPIQTCIVNDDFARSFGSHSNIFGIVIFRNI